MTAQNSECYSSVPIFGARRGHSKVWGLLIFCLLSIANSSAQALAPAPSNLHQWGAVTLFHGLPSNHVRAIAQTPDGALWFGTDNGLARYDGRRVQKAGSGEFESSRVYALALDEDGALWMGTGAGAARVVNGNVQRIAPTSGKTVTAIAAIGKGHAILATNSGEIFDCAFPPSGPLAIRAIGPDDHWLLRSGSQDGNAGPPIEIASLLLTDRETLLIGTHSRGLLTVALNDVGNGGKAPDFREIKSKPRAYFINALERDAQGRLWSGADAPITASGLYDTADLMRPEPVGSATGAVTALRADAAGNIWAGTDARGVIVVRNDRKGDRTIDRFTFENTGGGLLSNHIHAIFIDREGVVWFGTESGASRYDPNSPHIETISPIGSSNFVRTLLESSNGTLWSGTNRGLFVRRGDSEWQEVPDLRGRVVHALAEDPGGRIFAGTAGGLFVAPMEGTAQGSFTRIPAQEAPSDNIRAIRIFQDLVYIANYGTGVERLTELDVSADGETTPMRTPIWPPPVSGTEDGVRDSHAVERHVLSLHPDGERLWIGTAESGVFVFDGAQTTSDPIFSELKGSSIWSMAGSSDSTLWIATAKGLFALADGALTLALPGIDARSVAIANDGSDSRRAAWCGAVNGGLYKVALNGPEGASLVSKIDSEQGLPSQNVFSILSVRSSTNTEALWIGASHGIARYEPGHAAPVLNLTRVLGKRQYTFEEVQAGLELEYPQNSLAVEVAAASSRTFPEQFQYAFSVLDAEGHPIKRKLSRDPQLLIDNLKPGRYEVVAGAFTRDLVASSPMRFAFSVAPAPFPWTSTALSVLLILALVAMAWGYRQNSRLARANSTLETTNVQLAETRFQLANETETERRRIARDLHDQTLADLRRLMMLTDRAELIPPAVLRREIESVSTEVRRICEDLSPSALANVGLAAALEWAVAEASASQPDGAQFGYQCALEPGIEEKASLDAATAIQVYRIVQETLSNVCKHANATEVKLTMAFTSDDALMITLEDNGRGFDLKQAGKSGRGLSNIGSRASLIDAVADWSPRSGGGTIFTLRRPAGLNRS